MGYNYANYAFPYQSPNGNPYGFSQYGVPQAQPVVQQMSTMQNLQPVQQPSAPQANQYIWVSSEEDARNYMVAANSAVTLWNSNEPVIYLKQADASGKPSMKIYDLVERRPLESNAVSKIDSNAGFSDSDEYKNICTRLENIEKQIKEIME